MARGPGVSIEERENGRWRVRWREWVEEEGQRRRVQRSLVVEDHATAIEVQAKVLRAVETGELYEPEAVREIPAVATVDAVLDGWLESRAAKGVSRGTLTAYGSYTTRLVRTLRALDGLDEDKLVPGSWLSRDGVIRLTNALRAEDLAPSTVYWLVRALVQAWVWACDDPETYPGLAPAPRDLSSVLPRQAPALAGIAPTMAECDAVLRRAPSAVRTLLVVARCTGLRVGQIVALEVGDVDLDLRVLHVRTGKSAREKLGRTMPLAPVLLPYLQPVVSGRAPGDRLLLRPNGEPFPAKLQEGVRQTWEAATAAGEVRRPVWAPEGHKKTRPDHAFRAAFQAHLVEAGVRDETIDLLVGHAGGLREQHYVNADPRWPAAVAAMALIPPIDWQGPGANVVPLTGRAGS